MGEDGGDGIGCVAAARRQYVTPSPVTSHSAMVLVQALFAGMHITASPALEYIPPVAFCALRLILALPFLGYLAHREGGRWFRGWEWFWPAPMGAAIGTAYVLIFVCNQRSGPNVTAMVQPAMPICTTLLSAALGLEKVSVGKAVGLAVATVGTATTLRVDFAGKPGKKPRFMTAVYADRRLRWVEDGNVWHRLYVHPRQLLGAGAPTASVDKKRAPPC